MTQTRVKFSTFKEYLSYSDAMPLEGRYELIDGALVRLRRAQYAAIGVPEYWLVDPIAQTVLVLSLQGETYQEIGVFGQLDSIASIELAGLRLAVAQVFD